MATCWHCYAEIPDDAQRCPVCNAPEPVRQRYWNRWNLTLALALLALAVASIIAAV